MRSAYENAAYRVDAPPAPFFLRVGERSFELDRWLTARGAAACALLCASNPGSMPLPEAENLRRDRALARRLTAAGFDFVRGESFEASTGGWREPNFLVADLPIAAAFELARAFAQAAILVAERGGPVRLVPVAGTPP